MDGGQMPINDPKPAITEINLCPKAERNSLMPTDFIIEKKKRKENMHKCMTCRLVD